jgi:ubiquinone/menaquinone biosynthesis C-methylase UbiE
MPVLRLHVFIFIPFFAHLAHGQEPYTYRSGDPYGSGKWYMNREIAPVMGPGGMPWLEREERNKEERTDRLIKNIQPMPGEHIADIGAGTGYHSFRMAAAQPQSTIYAVEVQDEMLEQLSQNKNAGRYTNVIPVKGTPTHCALPDSSLHKVLLVDVYHEFAWPQEMMRSITSAMKPGAFLYLVEFRAESEWVPIKRVHKMTEAQARLEMEAAGLDFVKNIGNLPWQHCLVFRKSP